METSRSIHLEEQVSSTIGDLEQCLEALENTCYNAPSSALSGGTIGQHTRHIIELFTCLLAGYESGVVNYEVRKRDIVLQTDVLAACRALQAVRECMAKPDKPLALQVSFGHEHHGRMATNYLRELLYNLEHAIHHMALIRVGVRELTDLSLPEQFGVAPGTLKHRKTACAQ